MGIWLELRCDIQAADDCHSKINTGPMGMTNVTKAKGANGAEMLMRRGKKQGWLIGNGMATCPKCIGKK